MLAPTTFAGKVVVITGVGHEGQVGEALALAFARHGARLALVDRTPSEVEARTAALRALGFEVQGYACDLTDVGMVDSSVRAIASAFGTVDVLVHAAGGFGMTGPVDESDPAQWHRQIGINLTTAYLATRALLPLMRRPENAPSSAIVYFTSVAALPNGRPGGMAAYAAAKAGLVAFMRSVAQDERAHRVRANAIAPTAVRTAANLQAMDPNTRYVERESVADMVMTLASEVSRDVTGQVVVMG